MTEPDTALKDQPWQDPRWGSVRQAPQLQSILRLQRIAGNQAAQRILGIGDGYVPPVPAVTIFCSRPANRRGTGNLS